MPKIARFALVSVLFAAACADDEVQPPAIDAATDAAAVIDAPSIDATDATPIDADPDAVPIDAPIDAASSVQVISCVGVTPTAVIAASNFMFTPQNTTITANAVIQVTSTGTHTFTSDTGLFNTTIGNDTCVRFTAAGTFPYHCNFHSSMTGTVVVN